MAAATTAAPCSLQGTYKLLYNKTNIQHTSHPFINIMQAILFYPQLLPPCFHLNIIITYIAMFFSLTNSQKILQVNSPLYSPFETEEALVFCSFNGQIIKYLEGQLKLFAKVNGQVRSVVFDPAKSCYYLTDLLRQSIISLSTDSQETELVNEYEGAPLLGPHSLILSNHTGNIFFTDCGAFGQNLASSTNGSLFVIDMQQQSIRSIALRCLSAPTGLAFSQDERIIYVAETGRNRILRFYESKEGIYYMSLFHQFSGRFGPTALATTHTNVLIAALFEFRTLSDDGCLAFLNQEGELLQKLKLPQCGPQISGLFLSRQTEEDINVLITENSGRQSCHKLIIKMERGK